MKKILSILLASILVISTFTTVYGITSEDTKGFKTIEKYDEITDIDDLLQTPNTENVKVTKTIQKDGDTKLTKVTTNQLLTKRQDSTGFVYEDYVTTSDVIIEPMATGSGSVEDTMPDSGNSCTISSRVYFTRTTEYSRDLIHITKITGGVTTPSPTRIDINKASLYVGQSGIGYDAFITQTKTYNVFSTSMISKDGGSFTIYPPSTWEPVGDNDTSNVGGNLTVGFYIPNTSNTWTDILYNDILN